MASSLQKNLFSTCLLNISSSCQLQFDWSLNLSWLVLDTPIFVLQHKTHLKSVNLLAYIGSVLDCLCNALDAPLWLQIVCVESIVHVLGTSDSFLLNHFINFRNLGSFILTLLFLVSIWFFDFFMNFINAWNSKILFWYSVGEFHSLDLTRVFCLFSAKLSTSLQLVGKLYICW